MIRLGGKMKQTEGLYGSLKERYGACRERIGRVFFHGEDPGEIVGLSGSGDSHLHGESVTKIETSRGRSLYYKPRDCRTSLLLGELTDLLFGERMVPEQVTGEGYAFQKAEEKLRPGTDTQKDGYYERLGRLTALFYALGSTDMHQGNILCTAGGPVVIDTETLLCAKARGVGGTGEFSVDYGEIFPDYLTSVGESMVLPRFYGYTQTSPLFPDRKYGDDGYEQCFIAGFEDGYRKILKEQEAVLRRMEAYSETPFRYLLRSTQYYAVKLRLYHSAKDDTQKESVLKSLEKGLSDADLQRWAPVLAWERSCIREGDVPYFCLFAGRLDLMGEGNAPPLIPGYLERSPLEYARWRMGRMGEQDLAVQTAYIRASLKHVDRWEQPGPERQEAGRQEPPKAAETDGKKGREVLSVQEAVREAEEAVLKLWEERIPLSGGGSLWHTPLLQGKIGCLFGLAEGFSGTAVFIHACACSPLITGEPAKAAKALRTACFRDMASFGEYLLETYPQPPEERIMSRRFNGDFGFADGLSGYLWALKRLREEDRRRTDRLLEGFAAWHIEEAGQDDRAILKQIRAGSMTDCLENGTAGKAAGLLFPEGGKDSAERLEEAGVLLKAMVSLKRKRGCYRVFPAGRRSYFLPAFLRGTSGIAYVLLSYASGVLRYSSGSSR